MTISEQNDKTLKQITVQPGKKVLPKPKSDPLERKLHDIKPLVVEPTIRPKSWPNKLEVNILLSHLDDKMNIIKNRNNKTEKFSIY